MNGNVYWSARDLDHWSGVGNHHFILIVFDDEPSARQAQDRFGIAYQQEKSTYYMTLAGFKDDDRMVFEANNLADQQSVQEWIDPEKHTSWYKPDYDIERHEIKPRDGDRAKLVADVIGAAKVYEKKGPINYHLLDENCAAWNNTLLAALGFSKSYRHAKGEFEGFDWGEEDEFSTHFFIE